MEETIHCPVCDTETEHWNDYYYAIHCLMEEAIGCPECGYYYEYHTGQSKEHVGNQTWHWSYSDSTETKCEIRKEIEEAIKQARLDRQGSPTVEDRAQKMLDEMDAEFRRELEGENCGSNTN